jgi:TetR/AcrR family transcriptional regulator, transcriptional repressor for nem operon
MRYPSSHKEETRKKLLANARADPEVKATVEQGLKQLQKSWAGRIGNPDAAWALIAQCVGALVLARCVESERTRKDILASSRRFIEEKHAVDPAPASRRKRVTQ